MLHGVRLPDDQGEAQTKPHSDDLLKAVYEDNLAPVYRFIYSRVGNREEAEDLTSQVFVKAITAVDTKRDPASIQAWLFQIARTTIADHWREFYRLRPSSLEAMLNTGWETPAQSAAGQPERSDTRVQRILSGLSHRYRDVLTYRFLMNFSIRETAERMRLSEANIKVLQFRALRKAAEVDQATSQ
jgi:RNA polymerase sigma-70 factor (ECF subfamily)